MEKPEISVIIPIFNEEENIPELYERLTKAVREVSHNYELIFINDGSVDDSLKKLKGLTQTNEHVFYINFSRNFGQQIAATAGLDLCRGKTAVIIDADLQDPPELIPELYEKHKKGYDVVYAKRESRKGESMFKKITSKLFYRFLKHITSVDIPVDTGDFRLISRKIIDNLKKMPEQNKFLRGQIAWLGFKQTHVMFNRDERKHGKTAYTFSKMFKLAMDGITGFSDKPLNWPWQIGILTLMVVLIIIIGGFYSQTGLLIILILIGALLLLSLGIIGAYIARINKNLKNRPLYVIEDTNMSTSFM